MASLNCPTRDTLFDFLVGKLSDFESEALSEHLEACASCQAALATLDDAGDSLVSRLLYPRQEDQLLKEPECAVALARAEAVAQAVAPSGDRPGAEAADQPPVPARLGEYELLEKLGEGGMGAVYKALHTKLDRLVAIKLLPPGRMGDSRAIARFEREMKAIGRLDHPNIARAHDAREIDGAPVLVMEYVEGINLSDLARRCGPMPVAEACELVRQAAIALQYAHEHGLVHRDVKPSNLMLAVGQAFQPDKMFPASAAPSAEPRAHQA